MKSKFLALAGAAVLLSCLAAPGVSAAQPTSPEATALARRYVAALHMENTMDNIMTNMMPALMDSVAKRNGGKVTDELRSAVTAAAAESARAMTPRMVDKMVPAIAESFTVAELQAAVTYYESPLAQSLLAKSPAYMAKLQPALGGLMTEMSADMEARLCKKTGCNAAAK